MSQKQNVSYFKPINGKKTATEAFASGSWLKPESEGPLGKIRWNDWGPNTIMAHAGASREGKTTYVVMPAIDSTTVSAKSCDELAARFANGVVYGRKGYIYKRLGNPTVFELECVLTGIHGSGDSIALGSGMAAISHALLPLVTAGDNVVVHKNVYGCTDDLLRKKFPELGVETRFADLRDPGVLRKAIDRRTRAVLFETPSNPALDIIRIADVASEVKDRCPIIVDNTFASPMGQNPFEHGAHIVVYSLTKSIGGHADAIGGAVLGSGAYVERMFYSRKDFGGIMTGSEAERFLKGIKTLPLRYERMEKNAIEVVNLLLKQDRDVKSVFYPALDKRYPFNGQMKGPGYVVAFELKKGIKAGKALIDHLKLITNAVSLGSVESLICHPASTTHACVPKNEREKKGITNGLIRISVGTENIADILYDLQQAFRYVAKA